MGIQDRDYYIERLRRRTGYTELAKFRVPLGRPRWIRPTEGPPVALVVATITVAGMLAMATLAWILRH